MCSGTFSSGRVLESCAAVSKRRRDIPSSKESPGCKSQGECCSLLGVGAWDFIGAWDLELGIYRESFRERHTDPVMAMGLRGGMGLPRSEKARGRRTEVG